MIILPNFDKGGNIWPCSNLRRRLHLWSSLPGEKLRLPWVCSEASAEEVHLIKWSCHLNVVLFLCGRVFFHSARSHQRCCHSKYGEGPSHQGEVWKRGNFAAFFSDVAISCNTMQTCLSRLNLCLFLLQDFPWIVADEQEVHMKEPRLIPLKSMTSDIVRVSGKTPDAKVWFKLCDAAVYKSPPSLPLTSACLPLTDAALRGRESPEDVGARFTERKQAAVRALLWRDGSWGERSTHPHQSWIYTFSVERMRTFKCEIFLCGIGF